jgi:hypothetical protein
LFEGKRIFGLCKHRDLVAGISSHSEMGGTVVIFEPLSGKTAESFRALPALDRRYIGSPFANTVDQIWGDIHEIRSFGSGFVIVNTIADSLTVLKADNTYSYSVDLFRFCQELNIVGAVYGRHSYESNYYHFNSVCIDSGQSAFYVMGHNTKSPEGSFVVKGDISPGDQTTHGLPLFLPRLAMRNLRTDGSANSGKQCHDLLKLGEMLLYSESVNCCIGSLDADAKPVKRFQDPQIGFIRGMSKSNGILFVGSSSYRRASGKFQDRTLVLEEPLYVPAILCIDLETWRIISIIDFGSFTDFDELEIRNILAWN